MGAILIIPIMILAILTLRFLSGWMLRINDVVKELKEINQQLKNK